MAGLNGDPSLTAKRRDVAHLSRVSDWRGLLRFLLILLAILGSAVCFHIGAASGGVAVLIAGALLAVWAQFACLEMVHEGAHRLVLTSKAGNDWLTGICASLIGMSLSLFRHKHFQHHRSFGSADDPDYLAYANRPSGPYQWLLYFLANFSGFAALRTLLERSDAGEGFASRQHPLGTIGLHLALLAATTALIGPFWYVLFWVFPLLTVTFGTVRFRTFLEHWDEPEDTERPERGALWNLGGFFAANLFAAPFGYNRHGWHHLFPAIPSYNLKHLDRLMSSAEDGPATPGSASYWSRIRDTVTGKTDSRAKSNGPKVMDSSEVTDSISSGGNLSFYLKVLLKDPKKILIGLYDSLREVLRFLIWPRRAVGLSFWRRLSLVFRFTAAEFRIPGATTLLETIWLIYAISGTREAPGAWVEVGCYKGLSTVRLSILAEILDRRLLAFDTFEGLPGSDAVYETVNGQPAYHFKAGSYKGTSTEVEDNLTRFGVRDRVELIKGEVSRAKRKELAEPVSFAFLDVDLVESYKACFEMLAERVGTGSTIVIAEAAFRPIRQLVEDAAFWREAGCAPPAITYIEDRYGIRTCQNLAFLSW